MRPYLCALIMMCAAGGIANPIHAQQAANLQTSLQAAGLFTRQGMSERGDVRIKIDATLRNALRDTHGRIQTQLPLTATETVGLQLRRFDLVAPDARFVRAAKDAVIHAPAPQVILLRGEIVNDPASRVFLALTGRGGGSGSVQRGNGEQLIIGTEWINGSPAGLIVQPGGGMAPDPAEFCAAVHAPGAVTGADGPPPLEARGPRVLNVAIDADQSYCNLFSDLQAAEEYIVQVLGAVSDIYQRDLNLRLVLRFARLWPQGGEPFSADSLSAFRTYWIENEDLTGLNYVHMFSGRRDTSYGGIAYITNACSTFGFAISAFLMGSLPAPVGPPHLGNWDVMVIAHEMGHNLSSPHTHSYDPPIDFCTSGVMQRGTIMSYCHTNMGGLLNTDLSMHTTVAAYIAASNSPPDSCLWHDCNANAVDDAQDILLGSSQDANANGIPDECEDCNANGVLDSAEIALGAPDVNANGILDACEPDCNANAIPDAWEIAQGAQQDFNGNGVPDSCEPDCDSNGVADFYDIFLGAHADIDRNSVPDICQDCNGNGVVDWIDVDRQFNIFISQTTNSLREYHRASGMLIGEVGAGAVGEAYDIAFGADRQLYVASFNLNKIVRVNVDTGAASDFVAAGAGGLSGPSSLAFGPDGHLYVASQSSASILKFNGTTGAAMGAFVTGGSGGLTTPWDIAFGPNGNLFVISGGTRVLQYNGSTGAFVGVFINSPAGTLVEGRGLAFLPSGQLLVADRGNDRINRYSAAGAFLGKFNDTYPLPLPWAIAVSPAGTVFAAQTTSNIRVIEYDAAAGRYLRSYVRGDAGLSAPSALAFRPASPHDANGNNVPDACEQPPCLGDIAPASGGGGVGDGTVNVLDLLAVINGWGACPAPCPPSCPSDINGNCTVNVQDLLAVINNWGPCP